jgi:predicted DNA-binding transcriptional regulator AlpA
MTVERDVLTIDDLMRLTGWGRTYTYHAAKTNALPFPVLRSGRKYFISRRAYERWLAGETSAESGHVSHQVS